jgi:hypothetical protein
MKTFLPIALVLTVAACAGSPTAPSTTLGAPLASMAQTSELTGISACTPSVAAPGWVTINQSSFGGPLVVEFERRGGHTDFAVEIDRRNDGSGLWHRVFTFRTYAIDSNSVDYRPSIDGTYRGRVRAMGRCEGSWSDYKQTGVDGFEADVEPVVSYGGRGGRGGYNHGWGDHSAGRGQGHD